MNENEFIPTRRSLLSRLRNWEDQKSWQEFFDTYGRLIYCVAVKAGLTDAEAQDVVQETVIVVARKMPGFKYDPAIGSFKSWLMLITRRRIEKQLRKRIPVKVGQASRLSGAGETPALHSDDSKRTSTVERIADPKSFALEAAWDAEWERNLWNAALARVKAVLKPKQFQMFDLYVLKEWPVKEVARALGVSATHVYVTKHRVAGRIKAELQTAGAKIATKPRMDTNWHELHEFFSHDRLAAGRVLPINRPHEPQRGPKAEFLCAFCAFLWPSPSRQIVMHVS